MNNDNGGPAFPVAEVYDERGGNYTQYGSEGMTLRDYFAAKAMQGIIASGNLHSVRSLEEENAMIEMVAIAAHRYADAMLKERAK